MALFCVISANAGSFRCALRKSSRSLCHLLMSSCTNGRSKSLCCWPLSYSPELSKCAIGCAPVGRALHCLFIRVWRSGKGRHVLLARIQPLLDRSCRPQQLDSWQVNLWCRPCRAALARAPLHIAFHHKMEMPADDCSEFAGITESGTTKSCNGPTALHLISCPAVRRAQWLKYKFGGPGTLKKLGLYCQLKGPFSTCLYH